MGAVFIGVGFAVAIVGLILGVLGFSSSETTSGAAILNAGSIGFVGGMLFLGLGFLHRALVDVAQRLDGIVHFELDEEEAAERDAILDIVEEVASVDAALPERKPAAPVAEPAAAPEPELTAALPSLEADEAKAARGGLPSWFRRKREAEPVLEAEPEVSFEPEPAAEAAPDFDLPPFRPATEAPRRDLPAFLRAGSTTGAAERPLAGGFGSEARPAEPRFQDLRFGEARTPEPRISEPRIAEPRAQEPRAPEPRAPEPPAPRDVPPHDEPEPGPPPTFLRESDLLGDDELPPEPEVTVLKSGTIGGMAYKLYSDGSIEADLPDGTLRFASLQELRDHVAGSAARGED